MKTVIIQGFDISAAAAVMKSGGLCAVPTETVYGLAADGLNAAAVAKIYEVKGRPSVRPISLLVKDKREMDLLCAFVPDAAKILAEKFWPGPLTIVLKKNKSVPDIVTAGGETIGLRCPNHEKTLALIELSGVPLAAPSANYSGEPSPKNLKDVLRCFDGKIDCAIDGGECAIGLESTIVDLCHGDLRILRQGALPEYEIRSALEC